MSDRYAQLIDNPVGRLVAKNVGLPQPVPLDRYEPGQPVARGPVLLGAAPGGRLRDAIERVLTDVGAEVRTDAGAEGELGAVVFDATGIGSPGELAALREHVGPTLRRLRRSGRVVVLGTPPQDCGAPAEAIAQRALEGFTRSVGKEVRRGATAQLVLVAPGAEDQLDATLRFLLSAKSAYVSGQVVRITPAAAPPAVNWDLPLDGRVALVTGASRGIGAAIANVLARDGAHVVGLDVPALAEELEAVMTALGGSSITLDITEDGAPRRIAEHLSDAHGGVDVVVHNAGITRDKTLGRMDEARWDSVMAVNLVAPQRITDELLERELLRDGGRVVGVSSISGIAGNAGQTNYATSKAGVIGLVDAMAPVLAEAGATINAVAPGFIETQMTGAMPIAIREAGRRMNSMSQGGLPVDVAEAVAWLAGPAAGGVNGNVVRVCGQSLLGA